MWDIFAGVFSGIVLLLIERFLIPMDEKKHEVTNAAEKIVKSEKIIIKEKVVYVNSKENDENMDSFIWLIFFLMIISAIGYIKYRKIVHSTIIIFSIAIGTITLGMAFFCIKKGIKLRNELNFILIINTFALVVVPYIIKLAIQASEKQGMDMVSLKYRVEQGNLLGAGDMDDILFFMYQTLGMFCIIIYLFCVFISNIYIISVININLDSKWNRMWLYIYTKTYRSGSKPITIFIMEMVFLIASYLLASGAAWNLIKK